MILNRGKSGARRHTVGKTSAGRCFLSFLALFCLEFLFILASTPLYAETAQSSADEMDDLDSMFEDSSDSVGTEGTPVTSAASPSINSPVGNIVFNGSVKANLGYIQNSRRKGTSLPTLLFMRPLALPQGLLPCFALRATSLQSSRTWSGT